MLKGDHGPKRLNLQLAQTWKSFEKFSTEGEKALSTIKNGAIVTLTTKTGQYRIIEERDFQQLYGLARDVDRLRGGLRAEAVAMLGELPELPIRDSFEPLMPENIDFDEDDDVMLDPDGIERPFSY